MKQLKSLKAAVFGLCLLVGAAAAHAVDLPNPLPGRRSITLEGAIDGRAFERLERALKTKTNDEVMLHLNSTGGSVDLAMQLGRLLRTAEAKVKIKSNGSCESACVLLYAAGVERTPNYALTKVKGTGIGIHRMYLNTLKPGLSVAEVNLARAHTRDRVKAYLQEMNVSSLLWEMMEQVPPENVRYLTHQELKDLGLGTLDVGYEEREIGNEAGRRGITSAQFREMRQAARKACRSRNVFDYLGPDLFLGIDMRCAEGRGIIPKTKG